MTRFLSPNEPFPPVKNANTDGLLAVSQNLNLFHLKLAYQNGIFPWYNPGEWVHWYAPPQRMVLFPNELKISKSMKKILRNDIFKITYNQDFHGVIQGCSEVPRIGQHGTWIGDEIMENFIELNKLGWAKSVEVWNHQGDLVGGLYGISVGDIFCGESMFAKESNASKAGFITFVKKYQKEFKLIDCQVYTAHLASLGARLIPREHFMEYFKN